MGSPPVVNASPLIYLSHAGLIDLLQVEGATVHVPRTVSEEILRRGPDDPTVRVLSTTAWLQQVEPVPPSSKVLFWSSAQEKTPCFPGPSPIRDRWRSWTTLRHAVAPRYWECR